MNRIELKRGEVYMANLPKKENSRIQGGKRPIVIWSNNKNNRYSTVINYYTMTSQQKKLELPVHVVVNPRFLPVPSVVLCEQPRTDDEGDIMKYIDWNVGCMGKLSDYDMDRIFVGTAIQGGALHLVKNIQRQYAIA